MSGDLDMLQLVSDHTRLMFTRMGANATIMYDTARIHERYGLTPHQMIDFKALKGDTTDNIPGLAGVGDKTAAKLLEDYGSLDGVFEHIDEVKPDKLRDKLAASRDDLMLWRELVTIDRDAPVQLDLEAARLGDYDRAEVIRLFREYEFRTLVERLPAVDGESPLAPGDLLREADRGGPVPAAQVAGRSARAPGGDSGLQLSLDFGNVSTPRVDAPEPVAGRPIAAEMRTHGGDPADLLREVLRRSGRRGRVRARGRPRRVAGSATGADGGRRIR